MLTIKRSNQKNFGYKVIRSRINFNRNRKIIAISQKLIVES